MTDHVTRLYVLAASILALFLGWLGIAAQPWASAKPAAQAQPPALTSLERRLNQDAALLAQVGAARRNAPQTVRIVTLPPLTTTRTS
jgi:hypothetical protein